MTSADVRARLTHALRLDLIGPQPDEPQIAETLPIPPSRWYLTGFLVPWNAPVAQKADEDQQDDFGLTAPGANAGDDDTGTDPPAARRSQFPSSIGVSVLVAPETKELTVAARWGDYEPVQKDGKLTGEWKRTERLETVTVKVAAEHSGPISKPLPNGDGLEIVTSVRTVKGLDDLPDLPKGTRAVSVFLVNRRDPEDAVEFKDRRFAFQAQLTLDSSSSFVPRPNSRGRQEDEEWDERVADLQYRDVMEFAVGHGTSTRCALSDGTCTHVETTWVPSSEVERVEPASCAGVELSMEALASVENGADARNRLSGLVSQYRTWIEGQRTKAPQEGTQKEVSNELLARASLAAGRIDAGLLLLDDPVVFHAFRLVNRAMAMAARQRRSQERGIEPTAADVPEWRPFQLAFLLMNLRSIADPRHPDRDLVDLLFFPTGGGKTGGSRPNDCAHSAPWRFRRFLVRDATTDPGPAVGYPTLTDGW